MTRAPYPICCNPALARVLQGLVVALQRLAASVEERARIGAGVDCYWMDKKMPRLGAGPEKEKMQTLKHFRGS